MQVVMIHCCIFVCMREDAPEHQSGDHENKSNCNSEFSLHKRHVASRANRILISSYTTVLLSITITPSAEIRMHAISDIKFLASCA